MKVYLEDGLVLTKEEQSAYISYAKEQYGAGCTAIHLRPDIDDRYLMIKPEMVPFNRLRRITGYLVGDTSRWNDAKRAELEDRVKHGTGM